MRTKFFTLFAAFTLLFGANVMAQELTSGEFIVNGIKYNGDAETQTASVIGVEEGFAQAEVIIPETVNGFTVTTVGDRAFANNKTITSVSLPNTVKSIEEKAFRGCTNLQSVSLGSSLETIGNDAFRLCENLASIDFPNSVYEIGEYAFYQCVSLRSVVLPTSLKAIRNSLFCQCENLESVEIPNSVEVIETWAFMYCESLKSITIPSSVVSIIPDGVTEGYLQFSGCSQLESIVVEEGNPVYDSRNNANAIIETSTNTLIIGCNNSTVPEGVERIDDYAFYAFNGLEDVTLPSTLKEIGIMAFMNTGLKSIEIPASIESLGEAAFNGCESLRKAVLPNTLTSIPASLFIFCRSLEEVNIPNGVESIGDMAFRRCGFSAIEIPTSVKTIGEAAFQGCVNMETITIPSSVTSISEEAFQNCDVLHTVVSQIETPFAIESNVFSRVIDGTETPTTATLYVPKGCKELYKSAEGWNQFSTILEEGETPEPEGLLTGKNYRVKNVTTGLYLQVEGNNTNMKLQNKAEGVALMQVFQLEEAAEGMYYIKAADSDNNYYAHASGWNFNATTNADNKTPFTIALVEGETEVYTLHQSVSTYKGLAGADAAEAGAAIYCNKGVDNNGKWAFEALTEEENAAYVTTLTATARQAVEDAIVRGEAVVANRSAVLTAEEVAAINNAVQAAKEGKDAAADAVALTALAEAIHTAVDEAIYVWNTDALSNAMCYAVSTEDRGAWYAQASNLTSTTKAGVAVDVTDKQQFAFVQSPETGALYLYSVSEAKFVKAEGGYTALTEDPVQTVAFLNGTRSAAFPWVVALNAEDGQKQMGISNGYDPAVITHYNDLGDGGNTVCIVKVTTFDATAALAAIEALETGIEQLTNDKGQWTIYDLMGRKVEKATKGIYIVNGKKVIMK